MTSNTSPRPGTIGLVQIHGNMGTLIEYGQWLCGAGFKPWEHSFVLLDDNTVIMAEPSGAKIVPLSYYAHTPIYWCHALRNEITDAQAEKVVAAGRKYKGVEYSFIDYELIFQTRVLHLPAGPLKSRLISTKEMICSQLCVQTYTDAGEVLFPKWYPGQVTPLDIYDLDAKLENK